MTKRLSRRRFLQASAVAGTGVFLTHGYELSQARPPGPNARLHIGIIGAGGRGGQTIGAFAGAGTLVALCDVDAHQAAESFGRYPNATKYKDFRVMLDKQKDIDAVVVSTPDHTHAVAAIAAMKAGKHVYVEKPLTHDIYEARQMKEVAAKQKVVTQMGNQGTDSNNLRQAVEVVRAGAIGDVTEVHVWTGRPSWPQNIDRPKKTDPVPNTLDWELWLGTAPERPYVSNTYVPFKWRGWWDFGTGALGDMGCHTMNLPYMALRLGIPTTVSAEIGTPLNAETLPRGATIVYQFPARDKLPACRMTWYEGGRRPATSLLRGAQMRGSGSLLIGSKGMLYSPEDYGTSYQLLPREDFANYRPPQPTLPRGPDHIQEFVRSCTGQLGRAPMSNFDHSATFVEAMLLGNLAIRCGKPIHWDAANMRATDLPQANQYIRREYRKGWTL